LHQRNIRSVTTISIELTNNTITTNFPETQAYTNVYDEASRIGWIIFGTIAVFIFTLMIIIGCRSCQRTENCLNCIRNLKSKLHLDGYGII
jgi:hypothetical protein